MVAFFSKKTDDVATDSKNQHLAPTQAHIPISAVQDNAALIRIKVNNLPVTIVTAIVRVGAVDITRMAISERDSFILRYTDLLRSWRFPRQVIIGRKRQELDYFLEDGAERVRKWQRKGDKNRANLLQMQLDFMQQISKLSNPQIPIYHMAIPYQIEGKTMSKGLYNDGLQILSDRIRLVVQGLSQIGVEARRLTDDEIIDLLYAFYHPSLPALWLTPKERIASLMIYDTQGE